MKEALGQGCILQSPVEVTGFMFATRKVLATLHTLSISADMWEKSWEPCVPYGVEYRISSREHWRETPSASTPQASSVGGSQHCSYSLSCLSRCQELWVDACRCRWHTDSCAESCSLSQLKRHVYRLGNFNPGSVWSLVAFLTNNRNWRAWGLVLSFLKGMDRTNCIPAALVSLY